MFRLAPIIVLTLILSPTGIVSAKDPLKGNLQGVITEQGSNAPIDEVTLMIRNRVFERVVTVNSNYTVEQIPAGNYTLTAYSASHAVNESQVEIKAGETVTKDLALEPDVLELREVAVAPSSFSLLNRKLGSANFMDKEAINNTPHLGDDPMRGLRVLPGAAGSDFGSAFNVRAGEYREVLVTLDGMELVEPFHLKDFTGVFSFLDPEVLGGMNLSTGGYAAKYGNAMSGVLEMDSLQPVEDRYTAGISFGYVSLKAEGTFAGGLGSYIFSGRRGYLDILTSFAEDEEEEEENDVSYYDSYGKLAYAFNPSQKLSFSYLIGSDNFFSREREDGEIEDADSTYDDYYLWLTLDSVWTDDLSSQTVVYSSDFSRDRTASAFEQYDQYEIYDKRDEQNYGVKQDWEWALNPNHFLRFGFDFRSVDAAYNYRGESIHDQQIGNVDGAPVDVTLDPSGEEYSAYVSNRFRLNDSWVAELGLRYDRQTLLKDSQVSPRFNLAYDAGKSTWRFAYGTYHQAERAYDLQIANGVTTFSPAEKATHWLLGFDYRFDNGIDLRVEGFFKDLEDLRTRYGNLSQVLTQYPGTGADRVALDLETGEVHGLEFVLKQNLGGRWSWYFNYAWNNAEDTLTSGETIPRQWEQEHTVNAGFNYRYGRKWNLSTAWIYHSGWRITPLMLTSETGPDGGVQFGITPGPIFSERLPAFHKLDLRLNRRVFLKNRRSFEFYLDIANLYNRKNIRGYDNIHIEIDADGAPQIVSEEEKWLPLLPSFGITWRF